MLLLAVSSGIRAQKPETLKLFSIALQDSVPVKVWLPEDYQPGRKYPVIYEFIYDHTNFIAATLQNMWSTPQTIVVYAEIEGGNEHYSNPWLTDAGQKYYAFLKNELLDSITARYHTTCRTAMGLSQGADYLNYILRNDPQLFDSYAVFSIERPVYYQANLQTYTSKLANKISYFIAVANDMQERMDFAARLYDSLKTSPYLNIRKEYYPHAEHSYSILYGLPDALNFIYEDYALFPDPAPGEKPAGYFDRVLAEKNAKYGMLNYPGFILHLCTLLETTQATPDEIRSLLSRVNGHENTGDLELFNLGPSLMQAGLYEAAGQAFRLSLEKQKGAAPRMDPASIYSWLARAYEKLGEDAKALETLEEGYEQTQSKGGGFLLYRIGTVRIEKNLDVKAGIGTLKTLLSQVRQNTVMTVFIPTDKIYAEIAKGYWKLKDKKQARENLRKALELNPDNPEARELQKKLNEGEKPVK